MGWFAKLRVCLLITVAVIIITLAVAFSVLRAVLPHATGYLTEVELALEQKLGLPVDIDAMDADMSWLRPRLKLLRVRVYNADGKGLLVEFDSVTFALSYLDSIRYMSPMIGEIGLSGADLTVLRDKQSHWFLQGIRIAMSDDKQVSDELVELLNNTNFSLLDSTLHFRDRRKVLEDMDFQNVNIQVENMLGTHAVQASVDLPERYGKSLQLIAEINGDLSKLETANAEVYLNAELLQLEPVFDKLGMDDVAAARGVASTELWLSIDNKQVKQIKSRAAFSKLEIRRSGQKSRWRADSMSANFFWQRYSDAWRLDVSDFKISRNSETWAQTADLLLRKNAATGYQISASYFRLADLTELLPLVLGEEYPDIVEKISALNLQGDIYNLNLLLPPEDKTVASTGAIELHAVFRDLGFAITEQKISLNGVDGRLEYKDDVAQLLLASDNITAQFESIFRQPLQLQSLAAAITINWDRHDWIIRADSVLLQNADITTRSRVYAVWPEAGSPYLDMQTDFRDGAGSAASKYYPEGLLSKPVIDWLDAALSGGRVDTGSFVLKGLASDFPFKNNQGVMEVQFQASDMALKFLPDWPAIEELSASVRFHNESMQIEQARGRVYRGSLHEGSATINDLRAIQLDIDSKISAPADDVQQYILNSGLNAVLGDATRQIPLSGDLDIALKLAIPLAQLVAEPAAVDQAAVDPAAVGVQSSGTLSFRNNVLDLPALKYQLKDLTGELAFTNRSIDAQGLTANFEGVPVTIDAVTVKSPQLESVFSIKGNWPVDSMLRRFDWLPRDWFSGKSDWDLSVHVPFAANNQLRVDVSSSLVGTKIAISEKLDKPAEDKLPVELTIKLQKEAIQLTANSQNLFDLLADRGADQRWHVKVDAPWLKGVLEFDESFAVNSEVDMNFEYANLSSLIIPKAQTSKHTTLKPASIPSLNFHADKIDWHEWKFAEVDMKSQHHAHGMLIESIRVRSHALTISGKGSWLTSWQHPNETTVKLKVSSGNLGEALTSLGHTGSIDRGELDATVDWYWSAEPYRFSLEAVNGLASFKLEKGAMLDVKPGAGGRLLGLLNVLQLPRRLRLDFGDVYKDGFVFDTITGDMEFFAGNATTRNVSIEAASADIRMDGRVGLVAEDYDLRMEVRPNSSAAAFTGGTIAGGPIVGAGLVLLEKLFGVDKLAREKYTITGTWDDPVIAQPKIIELGIGGTSSDNNQY